MTGNSPFSRSSFLAGIARELSPSPARRQRAEDRYDDLGDFLQQNADSTKSRDVRVYPQGSGNIGTTNVHPQTGEFDIDLVVAPEYAKTELTQKHLNEIVGGWLKDYVDQRRREGHPLAPVGIEPGKRAWTLSYEDNFHMDVLAVVPDLGWELPDRTGGPSWLTDKDLTRWQATNPRGFAEWFRSISAIEWLDRKAEMRKRADVDVDTMPEDEIKTTLQKAVQVLKRHKDNCFGDDPDRLAPPSALITAVAAKAYARTFPAGGELADVLPAILDSFENYLAKNDRGDLWVANPHCGRENYADRYADNPAKTEALFDWLGTAQGDLGRISTIHGAEQVATQIEKSFGGGLGGRVAKRIGLDATSLRAAGAVGSTAAGTLTTDGGISHSEHDFYGQPSS